TDENNRITGFYDEYQDDIRYISGGIYCLAPSAIETLQKCMDEGLSRMRNFQRQLVVDGRYLKAYPFSKILDVDHASDIQKAEEFLSNHQK
ncbi:MAG: NDP-sugar synthase, partial [Phocaeicola sp.]|nr:NDP-sugar synthase [Phocaeicola sp.]